MCLSAVSYCVISFFFFHDTATTEIYTLSLHDALPIYRRAGGRLGPQPGGAGGLCDRTPGQPVDRKSTRLNSSHANISYAVFCLKKKKILNDDSGMYNRDSDLERLAHMEDVPADIKVSV